MRELRRRDCLASASFPPVFDHSVKHEAAKSEKVLNLLVCVCRFEDGWSDCEQRLECDGKQSTAIQRQRSRRQHRQTRRKARWPKAQGDRVRARRQQRRNHRRGRPEEAEGGGALPLLCIFFSEFIRIAPNSHATPVESLGLLVATIKYIYLAEQPHSCCSHSN